MAGLAILGIVALGGAVLIWLAVPTAPSSSKSLAYRGYTSLPKGAKGGLISVLDYLTVSGGDLFVAGQTSGVAYRIALNRVGTKGPVATFAPGPAPHGVALDPVSHMAFLTRSDANTVEVFDPASMAGLKSIPVPDDPDGIFFIPFANLIYVANGDPGKATLIDPHSRAVVGAVPLGGKPEFAAVDAARKVVFQNLVDRNAIAVVDVIARKVVRMLPVPSCDKPHGLAFDEADRRLFMGCSGNSKLIVFNPDEQRVVASVPVGKDPDTVAYDPVLRRVYVTGKSGVLSVVQQAPSDAYTTMDTIKLRYGAHTLAVDPVTHRVFVGYASLLTNPRIVVFDAVR